ncbi:MAG: gluconeogenesis factor YvcK family protein [Acidimicrobiales bacterium]
MSAGGGPHVVALGGGHGLATTLQAVRRYAGRVTAVVSVADDGGSSGRLRQIAGIPAPGDLRRCLVAMATEGSVWARAFEYRFPAGDLEGHALGNLLIAGLANVTGDFGRSLDLAAGLLGAVGRVLPATTVPVVLKADVAGSEVLGQVNVSESAGPISSVSIVPPDAPVAAEVLAAIAEADQVVLGPGSLFTSVLAVCAVPGIRSALAERRGGRRVYVCNLRPQPPETSGFGPSDHLRAVLAHGVPVDTMVAPMTAGGEAPGPECDMAGVALVTAPLAREDESGHDPKKLAAVLGNLA